MTTKALDTQKHCAYCGRPIPDEASAPERFCSEAHAEEFVEGVRAARLKAAARAEPAPAQTRESPTVSCAMPPVGQRTWGDYLKRAACWGAPLLMLLAIPLIWSGGWAAAGGSLLSVLALVACPLGMYFMMRAMGGMQHGSPRGDNESRPRQAPPSTPERGR